MFYGTMHNNAPNIFCFRHLVKNNVEGWTLCRKESILMFNPRYWKLSSTFIKQVHLHLRGGIGETYQYFQGNQEYLKHPIGATWKKCSIKEHLFPRIHLGWMDICYKEGDAWCLSCYTCRNNEEPRLQGIKNNSFSETCKSFCVFIQNYISKLNLA